MVSQPELIQAMPPRSGQTQWSLVFSSSAGAAPAQQALAELCLRYGYPVYLYLRRCGHEAATAAAAVHGYFRYLADQQASGHKPSQAGRFREFLLLELHRYLALRLPSGALLPAAALAPATLEARYQSEVAGGLLPEASFQRAFAGEVLLRAQLRLQNEAAQAGRLPLFENLLPYLAREPAPGQLEALGAALGSRPLALVTAVKRLRQRFRELVSAELAETVISSDDLEQERLALHAALGK